MALHFNLACQLLLNCLLKRQPNLGFTLSTDLRDRIRKQETQETHSYMQIKD